MPKTLEKIEAEVFAKCTSLTIIELSPVLKRIEDRTFWGCLSLKEISLPPSLKNLDSEAFKDCLSLQTVLFANSRLRIKTGVFYGCDALETVVLPDGTFTFGKRNLKWGIPSGARLVTHKELAIAEKLMQEALNTPIVEETEEIAAHEEAEESAQSEAEN